MIILKNSKLIKKDANGNYDLAQIKSDTKLALEIINSVRQ